MKMNFEELFSIKNGTMATPRVIVRIGGTTMFPDISMTIAPWIPVDGINLSKCVGKDLEVSIDNNVHEIVSIYQ